MVCCLQTEVVHKFPPSATPVVLPSFLWSAPFSVSQCSMFTDTGGWRVNWVPVLGEGSFCDTKSCLLDGLMRGCLPGHFGSV